MNVGFLFAQEDTKKVFVSKFVDHLEHTEKVSLLSRVWDTVTTKEDLFVFFASFSDIITYSNIITYAKLRLSKSNETYAKLKLSKRKCCYDVLLVDYSFPSGGDVIKKNFFGYVKDGNIKYMDFENSYIFNQILGIVSEMKIKREFRMIRI